MNSNIVFYLLWAFTLRPILACEKGYHLSQNVFSEETDKWRHILERARDFLKIYFYILLIVLLSGSEYRTQLYAADVLQLAAKLIFFNTLYLFYSTELVFFFLWHSFMFCRFLLDLLNGIGVGHGTKYIKIVRFPSDTRQIWLFKRCLLGQMYFQASL